VNDQPETFEFALASLESEADSALRALASVVKEVKAVKAAAHHGTVRDITRNLENAARLADAARDSVSAMKEGWGFNEREYLESGRYTEELMEAARSQGVSIAETDGRIMSYPSLLRVIPGDASVEIDKKREKRIRPSFIASELKKRQAKDTKFKAEPFLEMLYRAYQLRIRDSGKEPGAMIPLLDLYDVLTILPQAREYSKQEFARDLYQLDLSRVTKTKDEHQVRLSAASGTRSSSVLHTVSREGEIKPYYAIAFNP
jgi:hypothetical protein